MPFVDHKLGQTYFQSRGSKRLKGLPIVCLHGGPGGHSRFMDGMFKLADERRVFIYDQLGGGRSSETDKKRWTVPTFVKELELLVDHWGLERFHLFGGSWGTTLALEYYLARKNRKRVASLLFQSPMFSAADWQSDANKLIRGMPPEAQKVIRYCQEIGATDATVYQEAMELYYAQHVCRNKARTKKASKIKNANGNRIYEHMWGASEFSATGTLKEYDRVDDLVKINCPTLLVCGQYDEARPETAKRYSHRISQASFAKIDNASHAIMAEQPRKMIRVLRKFLADVDPTTR